MTEIEAIEREYFNRYNSELPKWQQEMYTITMDFTKEEFKKIKEACKFINDGDPVTLDILMKIEVHFANENRIYFKINVLQIKYDCLWIIIM